MAETLLVRFPSVRSDQLVTLQNQTSKPGSLARLLLGRPCRRRANSNVGNGDVDFGIVGGTGSWPNQL
eukprot:91998-Pyramimonas_sp.AAC.1